MQNTRQHRTNTRSCWRLQSARLSYYRIHLSDGPHTRQSSSCDRWQWSI